MRRFSRPGRSFCGDRFSEHPSNNPQRKRKIRLNSIPVGIPNPGWPGLFWVKE